MSAPAPAATAVSARSPQSLPDPADESALLQFVLSHLPADGSAIPVKQLASLLTSSLGSNFLSYTGRKLQDFLLSQHEAWSIEADDDGTVVVSRVRDTADEAAIDAAHEQQQQQQSAVEEEPGEPMPQPSFPPSTIPTHVPLPGSSDESVSEFLKTQLRWLFHQYRQPDGSTRPSIPVAWLGQRFLTLTTRPFAEHTGERMEPWLQRHAHVFVMHRPPAGSKHASVSLVGQEGASVTPPAVPAPSHYTDAELVSLIESLLPANGDPADMAKVGLQFRAQTGKTFSELTQQQQSMSHFIRQHPDRFDYRVHDNGAMTAARRITTHVAPVHAPSASAFPSSPSAPPPVSSSNAATSSASRLVSFVESLLPSDGRPLELAQVGSAFRQRVTQTFSENTGQSMKEFFTQHAQHFIMHFHDKTGSTVARRNVTHPTPAAINASSLAPARPTPSANGLHASAPPPPPFTPPAGQDDEMRLVAVVHRALARHPNGVPLSQLSSAIFDANGECWYRICGPEHRSLRQFVCAKPARRGLQVSDVNGPDPLVRLLAPVASTISAAAAATAPATHAAVTSAPPAYSSASSASPAVSAGQPSMSNEDLLRLLLSLLPSDGSELPLATVASNVRRRTDKSFIQLTGQSFASWLRSNRQHFSLRLDEKGYHLARSSSSHAASSATPHPPPPVASRIVSAGTLATPFTPPQPPAFPAPLSESDLLSQVMRCLPPSGELIPIETLGHRFTMATRRKLRDAVETTTGLRIAEWLPRHSDRIVVVQPSEMNRFPEVGLAPGATLPSPTLAASSLSASPAAPVAPSSLSAPPPHSTVPTTSSVAAPNKFKSRQCTFFMRSGQCNYGKRCYFLHGDEQPPASAATSASPIRGFPSPTAPSPMPAASAAASSAPFRRMSPDEVQSALLALLPLDGSFMGAAALSTAFQGKYGSRVPDHLDGMLLLHFVHSRPHVFGTRNREDNGFPEVARRTSHSQLQSQSQSISTPPRSSAAPASAASSPAAPVASFRRQTPDEVQASLLALLPSDGSFMPVSSLNRSFRLVHASSVSDHFADGTSLLRFANSRPDVFRVTFAEEDGAPQVARCIVRPYVDSMPFDKMRIQ